MTNERTTEILREFIAGLPEESTVAPGLRPDAVVFDMGQLTVMPQAINFREVFLRGVADSLNLRYDEIIAQPVPMQPYQLEIADGLGPNKLARARRLIQTGGKRRLKRAVRLHREVYGRSFSYSRISSLLAYANVRRVSEQFSLALLKSTGAMLRFGEAARSLTTNLSRFRPGIFLEETDACGSIEQPEEPGAYVGDAFYGDEENSTRATHRWTGVTWVVVPASDGHHDDDG